MAKRKLYIIILIVLAALAAAALVFFLGRPKAPAEPVAVNVWYVNDGGMWKDFYSTAEHFNETEGAESAVTVSTRAFESDETLYSAFLSVAASGNELPDIIICSHEPEAALMQAGYLADPTGYFEEDEELPPFDENLLNACTLDGQLFALPISAKADVLIYNSALCPELASRAGSFEELAALSKEYYDTNESGFFVVEDYAGFFRTAMAQLGDSFDCVAPHETDNENCKYIYSLLANMAYDRGLISCDCAVRAVADGDAAGAIVSGTDVMQYADLLSGDNFRFAPYPCLKNGKSTCVDSVTGMSLVKHGDASAEEEEEGTDPNEAAAMVFMKWFASGEVNAQFVGDSGCMTACGSYAASEKPIFGKLTEAMCKNAAGSRHVSCPFDAEYFEKCAEFNDLLKSILGSLN